MYLGGQACNILPICWLLLILQQRLFNGVISLAYTKPTQVDVAITSERQNAHAILRESNEIPFSLHIFFQLSTNNDTEAPTLANVSNSLARAATLSPSQLSSATILKYNYNVSSELATLGHMFSEVLDVDWHNSSKLLFEFAQQTPNIRVKLLLCNLMWQGITRSDLKNNPFEIIKFYKEFQSMSFGINETIDAQRSVLQAEIRQAIVVRSAEVLQSLFYVYDTNNTIFVNITPATSVPVHRELLRRIQKLEENIFVQIMERIYNSVEVLVAPEQVAGTIHIYPFDSEQNMLAHLIYWNRTLLKDPSIADVVKPVLIEQLQNMAQHEFHKMSDDIKEHINLLLPLSLSNLLTTNKICIRNITDPDEYLYECSQTYLMCTNPRDVKKAAYHVERHGVEQQFAFHSVYWSNRYIKMNDNTTDNTSATKNVYSRAEPGYWRIIFHRDGEYASFVDSSMGSYLCGGNKALWSSGENHAYTRSASDYNRFSNECMWLIENCDH